MPILTGICQKLIPAFTDDFEGFKAWVEGVTTDVIEIARELGADPEDATELLQSPDKSMKNEYLICVDEQRKQFLEMESTPGKGAVNMVEMTTQDLVCYISLVDKPGADLRD